MRWRDFLFDLAAIFWTQTNLIYFIVFLDKTHIRCCSWRIVTDTRMNVFLASFPHVNPEPLSFSIPVFTTYSRLKCYINTNTFSVFFFLVKHPLKLKTEGGKLGESGWHTAQFSSTTCLCWGLVGQESLGVIWRKICKNNKTGLWQGFRSLMKWTCEIQLLK